MRRGRRAPGYVLMAGVRTEGGIRQAAARLGCDVAAVKAVIDVESGGAGFDGEGRPKILFESHIFSRLTGSQFDAAHPTLSTRAPNRALYRAAQYPRYYQALQLAPEAAVKSCSWGLFQIMGFNWQECGEKSLYGFQAAVHHNEDAHIALFAGFVLGRGLADELRRGDWAGFARGYNGPGYAANAYDTKLAAAHARHSQGGK